MPDVRVSLPLAPAAPTARVPLTPDGLAAAARDLANAVAGEVRIGLHDRMLYATDASLYQAEPLAVVIPSSTDDARRALEFCAARGLPVLPRGGGTSLAGQCTNRAVVIDVSPTCRRVLAEDLERGTVTVEPGITIDDLNDWLVRRENQLAAECPPGPRSPDAPKATAYTGPAGPTDAASVGRAEPPPRAVVGSPTGWFFAPDPATSRHASIGGCIGNNAAGARSVLYGRTSESVLGVTACLADGSRLEFSAGAALRDPRVGEITERVARVVLANRTLIRERYPRTIRRNAGYNLDLILDQLEKPWKSSALENVNLAHLLCGSEGTLALTLDATLKLHPRPGAKGLAVLAFSTLDAAIAAVLPILETRPSAVELLDDLVVGLARANAECRRYVELMPSPTNGPLRSVLYVEYFADQQGALADRFVALGRVAAAAGAAMAVYTDQKAMLDAWKLRKSGEPLLHGIPGARKPITFIEDNAVPVENLAEFVRRLRAIVASYGTTAAFYAHASVGVLHVRPLLDIHDAADRERLRAIAVETADLARSLGGVMSGEHGDGRVRTPLLERFYGPELMEAMREVKRIFDPRGLLNPGNIVDLSSAGPESVGRVGAAPSSAARPLESMTASLRVNPSGREVRAPEIATFFDYHDQHGFAGAVEMCNGAGVCRKKSGGTMCPSYMATLDERHSTRGRGNALRLAITGQLWPPRAGAGEAAGGAGPKWNDPETLRTLDLCLSCKACRTECPSNVDIARLKAEYAAQGYEHSGRAPLKALVFGAVRALNRAGSLAPGLANALGNSGLGRAIASAVLGIDARRSLPPFAASLASAWRRDAASQPGNAARVASTHAEPGSNVPVVALFGDCFTMFNEPGVGLAAKRVLEACGYRVVLADAGCCGRAKISMGLLPAAIDTADAALEKLAPLVRDPNVRAVLFAEPSCLSAVRDDWLQLKLRTSHAQRRALADKSWLVEEFVERFWASHPRTPSFRAEDGPAVLLHAHCHQKALWGAESSAALLRRVFGPRLRVLDTGCCGMAGSFGFTKNRYDLSMRIGELALFPAARENPDALLAAPGTSCRHQLLDGVSRHASHPIELVAERLAN